MWLLLDLFSILSFCKKNPWTLFVLYIKRNDKKGLFSFSYFSSATSIN